jgi:hypothetical protein
MTLYLVRDHSPGNNYQSNFELAIYFSATADEVRASNEDPDDTVRVIKDGGYLGTIGVYHGIHCLVRSTTPQPRTNLTLEIAETYLLATPRRNVLPEPNS